MKTSRDIARARHIFSLVCVMIFIASLALPLLASAQEKCTGAGGFVPLECFQGSAKLTDAYNTEELGPFLNKLFVGALSLGAILAVLRLAWAGYLYMASDLWTDKNKAREIITDTMLGLFLLIAIWIILNQINPQILELKINPPPAATPEGNDLLEQPGNIFQSSSPNQSSPPNQNPPLNPGGEAAAFSLQNT